MVMLRFLLVVCCTSTSLVRSESATPNITDLFHQLTYPLPFPFNTTGYYRIPSLVSSTNGTLLAFIMGRFHRRDNTPNIVYLRRSFDDGKTWLPPAIVLSDPNNATEYGGAPVVDPATGAIHFIHNAANRARCSACQLRVTSSFDHGHTWSTSDVLNTTGAPNSTWGGGLASGVTLTQGPHAGRMVVALRHDCGCGTIRASFVVYSDDHGATWTGGEQMMLLPEYGGGWTECQAAELHNGSVLMTSRNFYGKSSGQGPRMFARSDDGGATWAANWTAYDLPDPNCEGSLLSNAKTGQLYFGNPSTSRSRGNYSIHSSSDGGRTWPQSMVVYPGAAAYSDMAFNRDGDIVVLFEKDNYNTVSVATVPAPGGRDSATVYA